MWKFKTSFTPTLTNISASSSPTLIWSGCVGLFIINVPEENRRSPFTPPRLQHNNRKTTERGLSICLGSLEAVVYWAADQGNQKLGGSEATFTEEEADESIQTIDKCFNLCKQTYRDRIAAHSLTNAVCYKNIRFWFHHIIYNTSYDHMNKTLNKHNDYYM